MSELPRFSRASPEEIFPLAEALGVEPEGRDPVVLAQVLEEAVARAGQAPAQRGLRAPPSLGRCYAELAERLGVSPEAPDLSTLELRVARAWLRQSWGRVPPSRRAPLWAEVAGAGEAPPPVPRTELAAPGPLGRLARVVFVVPLTLMRGLSWVGTRVHQALTPDEDALGRVVAELAALRRRLAGRRVVALVGSPSAGKDAALRALFGVDTGRIHPAAGTTVAIERYRVREDLAVLNTPGLGDVDDALAEQARGALGRVDGVLYVLNAEGGVQAREREDIDACRRAGAPLCVALNKIDLLRPGQVETMVRDSAEKLALRDDEVLLPCAFDPMPALSPSPIGLDGIAAWFDSLARKPAPDAA